MKIFSFALVLCACFGSIVRADCEAPHALVPSMQKVLTEEEIDSRYRTFLAACTKAGGDVIDPESATYQGRIGHAVIARVPPPSRYPRFSLRNGISGVVYVAGIIETTGKVTEVTLIGTSGHGGLDAAALNDVRSTKYGQPTTLDGVPVRAFKIFVIRYKATST